jgi:ATPase subunit of ABC transporter with duplicated ATPase domains
MIVLENVQKRFGSKILFEAVDIQFDPGKRYGVTGANGAGKSTLMKMFAGEEDTDEGEIKMPGNVRLGVLKQNHFEYDEQRILDAVLMGNAALWSAMQEKETLLAGEVTDEIGVRLGELEGTISEENGYVAESEAAEMLVGLGIPEEKHTEPMRTLPSGYKLRVLLAQVLFGRPDVLLLDEPTNHLDLDSIRWLENFLIGQRGTVIIVSHDRHFLNSVATHIADIDYRTITIYTGSYDDFIEQKYENKQRSDAQSAQDAKKVAELRDFIARFGAHKSKSSQAQSRLKQIERLQGQIDARGTQRTSLVRPYVRFDFDKPSGRDVVRVEHCAKRFDEKIVFKDLSMNVGRADRVCVIGPSGIGKSTLLKMIVGTFPRLDADTKSFSLTPDAGEIKWGHEISVGYFAQDHHEALGTLGKGKTAFDWLYSFDERAAQADIRGIMGKLLFSGDAALKPIEALSGGEAARLVLAKLVLQRHNVLVLDEPTNHLDIESIEGLKLGLIAFKGTVIFVSHDRHFVGSLANRVMELHRSKDGTCTEATEFGGTYDEFLEKAGSDYLRK